MLTERRLMPCLLFEKDVAETTVDSDNCHTGQGLVLAICLDDVSVYQYNILHISMETLIEDAIMDNNAEKEIQITWEKPSS